MNDLQFQMNQAQQMHNEAVRIHNEFVQQAQMMQHQMQHQMHNKSARPGFSAADEAEIEKMEKEFNEWMEQVRNKKF